MTAARFDARTAPWRRWLSSRRRWVWVGALAVATVAWADVLTGPDLSFGLFYLMPIALWAWAGGLRPGVAMAVAASVAWLAADLATHAQDRSALVPAWNSTTRLGIFTLTAVLVSRLTQALAAEQALARTDALTGLANVRRLHDVATRELARLPRAGGFLAVAVLDVDGFKAMNDRLGHATGDEALKALGVLLQSRLRATDLVARTGGDEFVLLLPDTNAEEAERVVAEVCESFAQLCSARGWGLSLSAGTETTDQGSIPLEALVRRADAAMYEVKRSRKEGGQLAGS